MEVTGPPDEQQRFLAAIITTNDDGKEKYRILESLVPMPEALNGTASPAPESPEPLPNWAVLLANGEITQERYDELAGEQRKAYDTAQQTFAVTGFTDWHSWQAANWGVKWGDSGTAVDVNEDSIVVWCQTPWAPPSQGLQKISLLFPTLTFLLGYNEAGVGLLGAACFRNGVVEIAETDYPDVAEHDWQDSKAEVAAWEDQARKVDSRLASLMDALR